MWAVVKLFETDPRAPVQKLARFLALLKWQTFREPLELLDQCEFKLDGSPSSRKAQEYVEALYGGITNSLAMELGFCDLKDCVSRRATHDAASDEQLHSVEIRSLLSRYADGVNAVKLSEEDLSAGHARRLKETLFNASHGAKTQKTLGVRSTGYHQAQGKLSGHDA